MQNLLDLPGEQYFFSSLIKRPTREVYLYVGEATPPDLPDPHFLFAIASQP